MIVAHTSKDTGNSAVSRRASPLEAVRAKNPLHTKHTLHANKLDVSGSFWMLPNLKWSIDTAFSILLDLDALNIEASVFNIHSLKPSSSFV